MSEQIAWLESSRNYIKTDLQNIASNFIKLGFHLWEVQKYEYFKEDGYESVHEFAEVEFGIKKSTCYNYIALMVNFSRDGRSCFLDDKWKEYNYSQLVEMLSMYREDLKKIKPAYTIKQIREIKKHGTIVNELEMEKELKDFVKAYYHSALTKKEFQDFINSKFSSWSSHCHGDHVDFAFCGSFAKIGSYRYSKADLIKCVEKYVGFDAPEQEDPEEPEDNFIDTECVEVEDAAKSKSFVPWKLTSNSQNYELKFKTSLSDDLMDILKNNIKNVDKVAALVDFIDNKIKYCMWKDE